MKKHETNINNYIFEETESDGNNTIQIDFNKSDSNAIIRNNDIKRSECNNMEFDSQSINSSTNQEIPLRSKRLIISRRSSKKKVTQVNSNENTSNQDDNQQVDSKIIKDNNILTNDERRVNNQGSNYFNGSNNHKNNNILSFKNSNHNSNFIEKAQETKNQRDFKSEYIQNNKIINNHNIYKRNNTNVYDKNYCLNYTKENRNNIINRNSINFKTIDVKTNLDFIEVNTLDKKNVYSTPPLNEFDNTNNKYSGNKINVSRSVNNCSVLKPHIIENNTNITNKENSKINYFEDVQDNNINTTDLNDNLIGRSISNKQLNSENVNKKSVASKINNKNAGNNNLNLTQRSENFHKKSYEDNFKKSFDNIPTYSFNKNEIHKNNKSNSNEKYKLNDCNITSEAKKPSLLLKNTSVKANKLSLSQNSLKGLNSARNKYMINISKRSYIENDFNKNDKFKISLKKKIHSESPNHKTNKSNLLETPTELEVSYNGKSTGNLKRNNSNTIIHTNCNINNYLDEETIELVIPTPYPKNPYMLIEDPSLFDSNYTKILNRKYPPRKYLKHNLTSWLRYKSSHPQHLKDINIKLTNPKIEFKKLTYKNEDIIDNNNLAKSITDIKKAVDLIEFLKTKLLDYEIINNKNIDLAVEHIEKVQHENNFYKQKLLSTYDELRFYKDKYDDDILETNGIYDHKRYLLKSFRVKWLKHKFFYGFKERLIYLKNLQTAYKNFKSKREFLLVFKSFLVLEKNRINSIVSKNVLKSIHLRQKKKIFTFLKSNTIFQKSKKKFMNIQRHICLILSFKNFRYNLTLVKYFRDINEKARLKFYIRSVGKIFAILKQNLINQSSTHNYIRKYEESNKINFLNFFKNLKRSNKILNFEKAAKTKGLAKLKNIVERKINKLEKRYSSKKFREYFIDLFHKWKKRTFYPMKLRTFNFILAIRLIQIFFKKSKYLINLRNKKRTILTRSICSNPSSSFNLFSQRNGINNNNNMNNIHSELSPYSSGYSFNSAKASFYNNFFKKCLFVIKSRTSKRLERFIEYKKELYYRTFIRILKTMQYSNPSMRFQRIFKKFQYSIFFDKIKTKISLKQKKSYLIHKFSTLNGSCDILKSSSLTGFSSERKIFILNKKGTNKKANALDGEKIISSNLKYKITEKMLFNLAKKFLKIARYKANIKEYYSKKILKFQEQFIYYKNANKLIRRVLLIKLFSKKVQFEYQLVDIKQVIEEKSDIILKISQENKELRSHYEISRKETKAALIENDDLKDRVKELEDKLEEDNIKFKELFNKNLSDIKSLNTILRDSESLLDQAKKREEELQNKYCFDIQKAVWLNKQLNNIISKKNKLLADIKIKQNKKEVETNHEKMKLCKENAELYNEYNKILEMKEYEKFSIEEEKNKLLDDLDRLEMEKLKSEYKSNLLEEENKLIFNKMIDNIKNNK